MFSEHTSDDHIKKLEHDCKLAQELAKTEEYYDWTMICAFYFAVHCIEAYAHQHRKEGELLSIEKWDKESPHKKRERFVRDNLKDFFSIYQRLYNHARQSRYDPRYFVAISKIKGYHERLLDASMKIRSIVK